ncbi:MAG: cytidylate kinase-like family protein [Prevotella sp.]|jgi:cytidylate kinase|nr:cytidylate kinase-like family protein [Prevotella sp.]
MENKHIIINVGRQLGSGGHDIARMLAHDFNAKYYDKEILNLAAKESGFSEKIFEQNDEKKGFIRGLFSMTTPHVSGAYESGFSQENLFKFQSDAIRKAAEKGSCVFVGRCADYVLRDFENVVNIFITASMHDRVQQILNNQSVTPPEAKHMILQAESKRAAYYNYYTGKKWGHAESYDLCVNSSILGLDETEKMIADFIRKRFEL